MRKTKRLLMLLLAICISFIFCSCGTSDKTLNAADEKNYADKNTETSDTSYSSEEINEPEIDIIENSNSEAHSIETEDGNNILIAYFSR